MQRLRSTLSKRTTKDEPTTITMPNVPSFARSKDNSAPLSLDLPPILSPSTTFRVSSDGTLTPRLRLTPAVVRRPENLPLANIPPLAQLIEQQQEHLARTEALLRDHQPRTARTAPSRPNTTRRHSLRMMPELPLRTPTHPSPGEPQADDDGDDSSDDVTEDLDHETSDDHPESVYFDTTERPSQPDLDSDGEGDDEDSGSRSTPSSRSPMTERFLTPLTSRDAPGTQQHTSRTEPSEAHATSISLSNANTARVEPDYFTQNHRPRRVDDNPPAAAAGPPSPRPSPSQPPRLFRQYSQSMINLGSPSLSEPHLEHGPIANPRAAPSPRDERATVGPFSVTPPSARTRDGSSAHTVTNQLPISSASLEGSTSENRIITPASKVADLSTISASLQRTTSSTTVTPANMKKAAGGAAAMPMVVIDAEATREESSEGTKVSPDARLAAAGAVPITTVDASGESTPATTPGHSHSRSMDTPELLRPYCKQQPTRRQSLPSLLPPPYTEPQPFAQSAFRHPQSSQKVIPVPREEEGKEELPPYSNDIYLCSLLPRKMEFSAPNTLARDRRWKRVWCVLEGTAFKVYKDKNVYSLGSTSAFHLPSSQSSQQGHETSSSEGHSQSHGTTNNGGNLQQGSSSVSGRSGFWDRGLRKGRHKASASQSEAGPPPGSFRANHLRANSHSSTQSSISPSATVRRSPGSSRSSSPAPTSSGRNTSYGMNQSHSSFATSVEEMSPSTPTPANGKVWPTAREQPEEGTCNVNARGTTRSRSRDSRPLSALIGRARQAVPAQTTWSVPSANSQLLSPSSLPLPLIHSHTVDFTKQKPLKAYSMQRAESGLGSDYTKRKYVIRVRADGEQFLLQLSSVDDVIRWVEGFQASANIALDLDERQMPRGPLYPRRRRRRRPREEGQQGAAQTQGDGEAARAS